MKRAEKFLSQLSSHKLDIEHIELMQTRIKTMKTTVYELKSALLPSGISYDGVQVQTSPKDKFAEEMAKIVDIENQIDAMNKACSEELKAIVDSNEKVESVIARLDPEERTLIDLRHKKLYRWNVIGPIMGYSARHAQRKYKAILEKIESMI